jgi:hypothetical protein
MRAPITIFSEPDEVHARLAELGLTADALQHAARRWHASWAGFTPNHPAFGVGIAAWVEAVAALRETLAPDGWTRSDEKNFALVVDAEKGIAINIATGDAGTGRPDAAVSNKAPKGISTADAITANQFQLELFDFAEVVRLPKEDAPITWFLLLHRAPTEIRCELSLPSQMSVDGHITRWQERIILPAVPLDDAAVIDIVVPDIPDIDIDVKLKA